MLILNTNESLKKLGLNSYELRLWTALLSRGVSTAGELSDIANVPRSRSYDVLESLEKKGFVMAKHGKPIRYAAVPPNEVIGKVKKKIQEYAKGEVKKLSDLRNTTIISELSTLHTQGVELVEPADLSGSLRGRHNLYNHLEYMLKKAEKEVVISVTEKEFLPMVEYFKPLFGKLKKKNIKITILTQLNTQTRKYTERIKQFTEVNHTDNKARFCIVDGKEMMFMVFDYADVHPTYDAGIWASTQLARDLANFSN
ncbi:hypothetical protein HYW20_01595 [Candidatus Woesearchaeota archaeon]|nr:hypothetical protein [Candidatus Woesearchaeota archaeon]